MTSSLPGLLFLVPFVAALFIAVAGPYARRWAWGLTVAAMLMTTALTAYGSYCVLTGEALHLFMGGWNPPVGIEWTLDLWGILGTGMVALVALIVLWGTREAVLVELDERVVWFYVCSLLLVSGLMGMVLTADLFNLFVHMEITALCAYALVATGTHGAARAAFNYLIMGGVGATLYLLGVGFLYAATGSLNMTDVAGRLAAGEPRLIWMSLVLITIGLGIKMGLWPMHGWMPGAYSRTSVASAALMTPIVTKVAAFVYLRVLLKVYGLDVLFDTQLLLLALLWLGVAAMTVGGVLALIQRDLRRLLVYSSISQVGMAIVGIALANNSGLTGGLLHLVNDALMKGVLFLAAAVAFVRFGVRDVDDLSLLRGRAPWTAAGVTVACISLIGIPPLCGFFGKWYILLGALEARQWLVATFVVASSVITAIYVFRILEQLFLFTHKNEPKQDPGPEPREGSFALIAACSLLGIGIVVFGMMTSRVVTEVVAPLLTAGVQ